MAKERIYELAKELKMPSKDLVNFCLLYTSIQKIRIKCVKCS